MTIHMSARQSARMVYQRVAQVFQEQYNRQRNFPVILCLQLRFKVLMIGYIYVCVFLFQGIDNWIQVCACLCVFLCLHFKVQIIGYMFHRVFANPPPGRLDLVRLHLKGGHMREEPLLSMYFLLLQGIFTGYTGYTSLFSLHITQSTQYTPYYCN